MDQEEWSTTEPIASHVACGVKYTAVRDVYHHRCACVCWVGGPTKLGDDVVDDVGDSFGLGTIMAEIIKTLR
jgi:hypothetical protein